jgi:hypothetical protein
MYQGIGSEAQPMQTHTSHSQKKEKIKKNPFIPAFCTHFIFTLTDTTKTPSHVF